MKLTCTVNLWCRLSFVLAAKAMSSNLLPEYQHGYLHHGNASIFPSPTNTSANASLLLAPFYRNVTAGGAWVLPASPFDLGARAMTCECFDPDEKCCMGSPLVVGPFCIPPNATCCSSTVCEPGETCCGDYCCRSGTKCSTDRENPGCCPLGQSCSADTPPPTCLDHSSNCSGKFPPKQCCPSDLPFCSSQEGKGFGCYANAITVSSTKTISTQTVNLPPKTSNHHSRGTATIIDTVSVKIASASSGGGIALEFPKTVTLGTDLSGWSISTSYVFSFPSSILGKPETTVVGTSISNSTGVTGTSISLSSSSSTTTTSASHASHPSAPGSTTTTTPHLCFNPVLQTLGHCPTSTSTSSTSTSISPSNSAYPTELIIHSSAPHLHISNPHPIILALLLLHLSLGIAIVPLKTILNWVFGMVVGVGMWFYGVEQEGNEGDGTIIEKAVCDQDKVMISSEAGKWI